MSTPLRWLWLIVPLGLAVAWHLMVRPAPPSQMVEKTFRLAAPMRPDPPAAEPDARPPSAKEVPPDASTPPQAQRTTPQLLAAIAEARRVCGPDELERITADYFPALFTQDFSAALQFISTLEAGELRERLLPRFVRAWAAEDFAGAAEWIVQLPDAAERKVTLAEACFADAESNPAEAVRVWQSQQYTADDHVLENLIQGWANRDLSAARDWVLAQPPSLQRDKAVARLGYVLAQSQPEKAADLILRHLPSGPLQTEAAISVLHQWARLDPVRAAAWVRNFPEGPVAERARHELAGFITQQF